MDLELDGDVALCLAASSGLGLASATALAAEGADVAICGRTPAHVDAAREQVTAAAEEGTGRGGDVLALEADITDPDEMAALVDETVESFGGLDHLVSSAGGPPSGTFREIDSGEWSAAFDLLVMSCVHTLRAADPHLRSNGGGTWTAITSGTTREVSDDLVLSNAVRRGVIGLVETLSREWAPAVRANAVLPGAHETARIEDLVRDDVDRGVYEDVESGYADWSADVPLDRIGEPRELGDVVAFLASQRASYVTGAALAVDGGSLRSV
jgi:NAD(P)-dependent dehydrogenase (short-subunit alcohol dehydrogenase family)